MRTWIQQKPKSHCCGSIAVAVVAGITLEQAILLTGKKGCTRTKDLAKAFRLLGYECPDRLQRIPRPELAVAHLRYPKENISHWVVVDGDKIYDGIYGTPDGKVKWKKGWKLTSYLPLTKNAAVSAQSSKL